MNNAQLYSEFSSMPQSDSTSIAKEYLSVINGRFHSVLDIGCGPGDTLINKILPHLREQPLRVVGVDISKNMVEQANKRYRSTTAEFYECDIQGDLDDSCHFRQPEGYDLVTSFFCHNWIRNER